ncbi:class I SAM-dependent methyltransferase [Spirosoma rhododendri]|uniref:Class I SAM-dependent methyltransferase n=1 Tax=Spirosoma rhododendri TaxID=2728024 RepID=A0A7L5DN77_9BACT|nr:class I SAM-dependent methyltransferase [Spirosoma rhododendri]QJD79856.1 class I SAM-dependent methyltransferase [Spirosoma rhododendri]
MQSTLLPSAVAETLSFNQQQIWSETDSFAVERYAQFMRHFAPDAIHVLDVGCNTGRGGQLLKQQRSHLRLCGIDLLEDRIRRVPPGIYERLIADSATALPFDDNTFDTIVAGELVEHIPASELPGMLREFHRVLTPGGRVLLTTPNPHSYLVNIRRHDVFADPSHVNIMAVPVLLDHLCQSGFSSNRVTGSGKVTRHLGERFPLFNVYGSYLTISQKN